MSCSLSWLRCGIINLVLDLYRCYRFISFVHFESCICKMISSDESDVVCLQNSNFVILKYSLIDVKG